MLQVYMPLGSLWPLYNVLIGFWKEFVCAFALYCLRDGGSSGKMEFIDTVVIHFTLRKSNIRDKQLCLYQKNASFFFLT